MNDGQATARKFTPDAAIRSPIAREEVAAPACSASGVPRPSAVTATTRRTPCRANARAAGRVKSA